MKNQAAFYAKKERADAKVESASKNVSRKRTACSKGMQSFGNLGGVDGGVLSSPGSTGGYVRKLQDRNRL